MRVYKYPFWAALTVWCGAIALHGYFLNEAFKRRVSEAQAIARVVATESRCRIFLLGSSGLLFGLNAAEIERETGCAVANAAGGGFGRRLANYIDLMLPLVGAGDIVVLTDRCWTGVTIESNPCFINPHLVGWFTDIHFVPHLITDIRRGDTEQMEATPSRSLRGDLLFFSPIQPKPLPVSNLNTEKLESAIEKAKAQVALIRAKGAIPVLVAQPIFVSQPHEDQIKVQLSQWTALMDDALGKNVWVRPWVSSQIEFFTEEGQHPSALGRSRWTQWVTPSIKDALTQP